MVKIEKGKFIQYGESLGSIYGGVNPRRDLVIYNLVLPLISIFISIYFLHRWIGCGLSLTRAKGIINFFLFLLMGPILIIGFLFAEGGLIDAIYENGITIKRHIKLKDVIKGKHWIPWDAITKIKYGCTKGKKRQIPRL